MDQYEVTFLVRQDLTETKKTKIQKELEKVIKEAKGTVVKKDKWGKKVLAYEIANQTEADYYHLVFQGPASLPQTLRAKLQMMEEVIRELIIKREIDQVEKRKEAKS